MDAFYCPPSDITGDSLVIGGEEYAHLAHVLRKKEGDTLMVVDGIGRAYEAVITSVDRRTARCAITARFEGYGEPGLRVTLGVGVLKNPSKFDFIVEKATELGVREVVPMQTERTISSRSRSDRWRKLALAAMKQCGRSFWPEVRELTTLEELLGESPEYDLRLVAHEQPVGGELSGMPSPGGLKPLAEKVLLLIGPEGGFSDGEIGSCRGSGFGTVYLGRRRLRTETAAIAALALLMR